MPLNLLHECVAARQTGRDFRSIFDEIIAPHPLRGGILKSVTDGRRIWLDVPLTNGQSLTYDSQKDQFALSPAK